MKDRHPCVLRMVLAALIAMQLSVHSVHAACGDGVVDPGEQCDDGNTDDRDCCSNACLAQAENRLCDDGRSCTTSDVCRGGVCTGAPADPFCALDLPRFLCYAAKPARPTAPYPVFEPRSGEVVRDELGTSLPTDRHQLDLKKTEALCFDTSAGWAIAQAVQLEGYHAVPSRTSPPQPRATQAVLEIESGVGAVALKVTSAQRLLVPTGVALGSQPGLPPRGDHPGRFKCYKASIARGAFARRTLPVSDPFSGTAMRLDVLKPTHLCTQEFVKHGTAPTGRRGYLACFKAKLARTGSMTPAGGQVLVATRNAFGPEVLGIGRAGEVCLPAVQRDPSPGEAEAFTFLTEPGAVNAAMRTIWEQGFHSFLTTETASAAFAERARAEAVIRANLAEAARILLANLEALPPTDDARHISMAELLRIVGDDPAILSHTRTLLVTPPAPVAPGDDGERPGALARQTLMGNVAMLAKGGSQLASDLLVDLLASADVTVRANAVRATTRSPRTDGRPSG